MRILGKLRLAETMLVCVLGGAVGMSALALHESRMKQDQLVQVSYEQLSNLWTADIVGQVGSGELAELTDLYLFTSHQLAKEFADTTGAVVIASEAVITGGDRMPDITGWVHLETMQEMRRERRIP